MQRHLKNSLKKPAPLALAALLCVFILGQGRADTPVTRYGVINVTRLSLNVPDLPGALVTPSALFTRQAIGGSAGTATGTCQVFAGAPGASAGPAGDVTTGQGGLPDSLDAGDPIIFAGPKGSFATLRRLVTAGNIGYQPQGAGLSALTTAFPTGATVNIPGAPGDGGFPAFKNAALPDAPTLTINAPEDLSEFTPDQTIRWTGASQGGVMLFTGAAANDQAYFVCNAPDTGSFSLPAATQTELRAKGFAQGQLTALRTVSRVLRAGGAQLTISVTDIVSGEAPGS